MTFDEDVPTCVEAECEDGGFILENIKGYEWWCPECGALYHGENAEGMELL